MASLVFTLSLPCLLRYSFLGVVEGMIEVMALVASCCHDYAHAQSATMRGY